MALTQCPDCQKDVSTSAKSCPHCGYPGPFPERPTRKDTPVPSPSHCTDSQGVEYVCARCGVPVEVESDVCPKCGRRLGPPQDARNSSGSATESADLTRPTELVSDEAFADQPGEVAADSSGQPILYCWSCEKVVSPDARECPYCHNIRPDSGWAVERTKAPDVSPTATFPNLGPWGALAGAAIGILITIIMLAGPTGSPWFGLLFSVAAITLLINPKAASSATVPIRIRRRYSGAAMVVGLFLLSYWLPNQAPLPQPLPPTQATSGPSGPTSPPTPPQPPSAPSAPQGPADTGRLSQVPLARAYDGFSLGMNLSAFRKLRKDLNEDTSGPCFPGGQRICDDVVQFTSGGGGDDFTFLGGRLAYVDISLSGDAATALQSEFRRKYGTPSLDDPSASKDVFGVPFSLGHLMRWRDRTTMVEVSSGGDKGGYVTLTDEALSRKVDAETKRAEASGGAPGSSSASQGTGLSITLPYHTTMKDNFRLLPCCNVTKALLFLNSRIADQAQMINEGYAANSAMVEQGSSVVVTTFYTIQNGLGGEFRVSKDDDSTRASLFSAVALVTTGGGRSGYLPALYVFPP